MLFYPILSYRIASDEILPCPILSYPTPFAFAFDFFGRGGEGVDVGVDERQVARVDDAPEEALVGAHEARQREACLVLLLRRQNGLDSLDKSGSADTERRCER